MTGNYSYDFKGVFLFQCLASGSEGDHESRSLTTKRLFFSDTKRVYHIMGFLLPPRSEFTTKWDFFSCHEIFFFSTNQIASKWVCSSQPPSPTLPAKTQTHTHTHMQTHANTLIHTETHRLIIHPHKIPTEQQPEPIPPLPHTHILTRRHKFYIHPCHYTPATANDPKTMKKQICWFYRHQLSKIHISPPQSQDLLNLRAFSLSLVKGICFF